MQEPKEQSIELEDLLKLKRHEKPDEAFWDTFEAEMDAKRLKALVDDSGSEGARWLIWRWMAWALPFTSAIAIFAGLYLKDDFNIPQETMVASIKATLPEVPLFEQSKDSLVAQSVDFNWEGSSAAFVVDNLSAERKYENHHRVLYDTAMVIPVSSGSRYVADQLTSNVGGDAVVLNVRGNGHF